MTDMTSPETVPLKAALGGILLFGMALVLSLCYGFQYRADPGNLLGYYLPFSAAFFLLLILIAWAYLGASPKASLRPASARVIGLVLTTLSLSLTLYFYDQEFPFPALVIIGALLCAAAACAAFSLAAPATTAVLVAGLAALIYLAVTVPQDLGAANMLPIISAGCEMLIDLENPYLATFPGISSEPLGYLPGLVLPYCIPTAAGVDERLLNAVLLLAIVSYAAWIFGYRRSPERLSLGLFPLLLSPPAAQMMIHGHVWTYWLLVLCFVHAVWARHLVWAAIALGIMLATRQMSVFLAVPAAFYLSTQMRLPKLTKYGAITIATYLALMAPIILTIPDWVNRFYLGFAAVGGRVHLTYGNPMNQVSLSGLLTDVGAASLLQPLQVLMVALLSGAFWIGHGRRSWDQAIVMLGIGYVLIIGLNTFLHRYFYFPGLILIALAVAYAAAGLVASGDQARKSG